MPNKKYSFQYLIMLAYFVFYSWFWFIAVSLITSLFWLFRVKKVKNWVSGRAGKQVSVLYLEVFSPQGAGNRYRSAKWVEILNTIGFKARSKYVFEYDEFQQFGSNPEGRIFFHMGFLWRRFGQCLLSVFYDVVVVRREILMYNDYGNLFFERFLSVVHNHLILDFDDNISAAKHEPRKLSLFGKLLLEHPSKFISSLNYYNAFFPASGYLKQWLLNKKKSVNESNILVLPTCVDYDKNLPKPYLNNENEITIGWIGSHNNLTNLSIVIPALNSLASKYSFRLMIVCDEPLVAKTLFPLINIQWNIRYEIENFYNIDVGIMPLTMNEENKGKSGFKLIQYMGCGLVSMSTDLTANNEIVTDGVNGFLVPPDADWTPYFEKVFNLRNRYADIGKNAFEKIKLNYSFNSNTENVSAFLKKIVQN